MLSITRIAPGAGVDYLLRQVATGRDDFRPAPDGSLVTYHSDPKAHGEAPGWWAGNSYAMFGVSGEVTDKQLRLLIGEGRHPRTEEQLGRLWRAYVPMSDEHRQAAVERAWAALPRDATYEQIAAVWLRIWTMPERRPVAGFDVTVSPPKSVSLLWAFGDDAVKTAVMAAHHAGVRATLGHLRAHGAFTRLGTNGIVQVDTDGLAAAVFDHRMSRDKDPQLHSHIIVSSKVRITTPGGREQWLSLDSRAFYQASIAARVAYERGVESELGRRLGVRFGARPGSAIREVIGIDARAIAHYSKRRAEIETEIGHRTGGADVAPEVVPARRWRRRAQDATLRTRKPKAEAESTQDAVRRWLTEDRSAGLGTAAAVRAIAAGPIPDEIGALARRALHHARASGRPVQESDVEAAALAMGVLDEQRRGLMVDAAVRLDDRLAVHRAVAELTEQRAVFGLDHLELAIGRVLHVNPAESVARDWQRVRNLAARAVNAGAGGLRVLTPPALMTFSPGLIRSSDRQPIYSRHRELRITTRGVLAAENELIAYATRRGATPAPPNVLDAVAAQVDLSQEKRDALRFAVGDDRRVTGIVGPAGTGKTYLQRAVALAAQATGIPVIGLTVGQNAAEVLAQATREGNLPGIRTENIAKWLHAQDHPPHGSRPQDWAFQPGQWVILDEASQASTIDLARLVHLLEPVAGKLILVGDPAQIAAVGPGGMFRYLAGLEHTTDLVEVRRFTDPWEGPASLRLRQCDTTVLAEYDRRGRITSGTRDALITAMLDGWTSDTLAERTALMLVETQAEAALIAARARARLIRAGIVTPGRSVPLADGTRAGVGDIVVTRNNDRRLTAGDKFVANRDEWHVLDVGPGGALQVRNTRTRHILPLPAPYVATHVRLAYAATVDSAQGRTVHVARALVDDATIRSRLYVMATRGSNLNQLYAVVDDQPPEGHPARAPAAGIALLADILRREDTERSATETEQHLWAHGDTLHHWAPIYDDLIARAQTARHIAVVRALAGPAIAQRLADDPAMPTLGSRLFALSQAGYDPSEVLTAAVGTRELFSARDVAAVLAWRIQGLPLDNCLDPRVATSPPHTGSFTSRIPQIDGDLAADLSNAAAICDSRVHGLAQLAAEQQPAWSAALGPAPTRDDERRQWIARAQVVLTYRDRYTITTDEPIGPQPTPHDPARWGAWHRAQIVLGVATLAGQITAADDTHLHTMVAELRATDRAAPPYVAGALRTAHVHLVAAQQHQTERRLELASAQTDATQLTTRAHKTTPRWWQTGPLHSRAATQYATAQRTAAHAELHVNNLHQQLADTAHAIAQRRTAVNKLEDQHSGWNRWYQQALPTRYAGLAAAAELATRAHRAASDSRELLDAIRDTADRVRAVDTTRPQPHTQPIPHQLTRAANAGRDRAAALPYPADDQPGHDVDAGPSLDL